MPSKPEVRQLARPYLRWLRWPRVPRVPRVPFRQALLLLQLAVDAG